jgi:predicted DNA-binding transcriptional regulator AlpA
MNISTTPTASQNVTARLLNKAQLAGAMSLSVRSLENLIKSGDLPAGVRVGRFLFWEESVIAKWHEMTFAVQRGFERLD